MLPFRFYLLTATVLTQVYSLYGSNSSLDVAVTEHTITLQWAASDLNVTYSVLYSVNSSNSETKTDNVSLPTDNSTNITHLVSGLFPGQTYDVEIQQDSISIFRDLVTTSTVLVRHQKTYIMSLRPAWIQMSLRIRAVSSGSILFAVRHYKMLQKLKANSMDPGSMLVADTLCTFSHESAHMYFAEPLPVTNVEASSITFTSAYITWLPSNQSIQDAYQVLVQGITNSSFQLESPNVTVTGYLMQGLSHSSIYMVTVVTYSQGERGNTSQDLTMNTAPLPPEDVTVVAIDTQKLNITWESAPGSSQDSFILSYTYNATNGGNLNELTVNITCNTSSQKYCELVMPGIPGQVYEIRVYSKLGEAVSEPAMTMHSTIPLPVMSLEEILSNDTSIHLRWTLPDNLDYHFRHFIILVTSAFGSMRWEVTGDKQELPLTNLNTGSMYNVSIIVSTGYETSQPLQNVFYTYPVQVNSLTNNVNLDTTNVSFTVYWKINETESYDNFILNIEPSPDNSSFPLTLSPDVFNYTFMDLAPGRGYLVSVVTKLSYKESEPVNNTFRTLPNQPMDVTVQVVSGSEIKVDWKAAMGNLDSYLLTLTGSGDPKIVTETGYTFTFLGLVPGTQYVLKIESQSGGVYSAPVTSTFTTNPSAVTGLRVTMVTSDTVTIVWEEPVNTTFDTYEISIVPADVMSPVILNSNVTSLTYKWTLLTPGQLYVITMVTVSSGVYSESQATRVVTAPLSVRDLQALPHQAGLMVSWRTQNTSKQSGFTVIYQEKRSGVPVHLPTVVSVENQSDYSVEIPNLFPGGTYEVKVQAWQNVSGESASSSIQEVDGITKPKPVENVTATLLGTDVIDLDWSDPSESIHSHFVVRHRPSLKITGALWVENSTLSTNLTLSDLMPGERYEIEVYAVSDSVRSDVRVIHVVVVPLPPPSVSVLTERTSTSSVTLQWLYQNTATYVESWVIGYLDDNGILVNQTVPRPATAIIVEADVNGLVAGFKYDMSVQAVVQDVLSSAVTTPAVTKPINNIVPKFEKVPTNSSFIITYEEPGSDFFDEILFTISDTVKRKPKSDNDKQVEFTSLVAGTLYTVEVQTVSGVEKSDVNTIQAQTLPNRPIVVGVATANKITLTITRPTGGVTSYIIQCFNPSNDKIKDVSINIIEDTITSSLDNLKAYTTYTCDVTSVFGAYQSTAEVSVSTKEAAPSAVRKLSAVESAPTEVTLTWTLPEFQNGAISLYVIDYIGQKGTDSDTDEGQTNVTFPTAKHVFQGLKAGYVYTFHVRALTVAGSSVPATVMISLKTYKPPFKDGVDEFKATPKAVDAKIAPAQTNKLVMNFTNVFSDIYGEVIQYTVIVTEDKLSTDIQTRHILPGWKVARQDPTIKAYQAISNCSTFFDVGSTCDGQFGVRTRRATNEAEYKVFEIGSETGCENRFYCNGPLKPDTTYYVTLRAYTTMQHKDTPFSEPIKTAALPVEEDGTSVGGIVGGVVASITAIVVVIVVVIFMRRRMDQKSNMYRHNPGEQMTHRSSLTSRKSYSPINLANFKHHIQLMKADSDFKYAEQFEELKDVGRGQPCSAAELACNRGKNRFTNILPYDHSRVKLLPIDDEEGSDYINANYIPGYNSRREYIVSQGPLPATRDDFWRMIWEQNSRNIVMLTKCVEKGREKCDKYWPSGSDAVFYGDLQVATLNETLFPDWTVTEFRVSLGDQSRQIRHFHFTSWPDFGVPKKEQVLVRFVRMVREKLFKDAGPIGVHCSAGVGRSGTFVVLDRILQHIKTHDTVDIFNTVAELRKERVWMVQTEQQYICIHNCLLCVLEGREDEHIYDNVGHSNIAFEDDEGVDLN